MKPYYERNGITIYNADCLDVMPELAPPFDAIICDPPYGQTALAWDSIIPLEPMWENYKRLIKKRGAVVLFGSQPFTSKLVMSNIKQFKHEWILEKDVHSNFANAEYGPLKYHESLIVFCQSSPTYNPQMRQTERKSNVGGKGASKRKVLGNTVWENTTTPSKIKYPKSVIKFNTPKHNGPDGTYHPTQKPAALLQYLIRTYTNPGELILDNAAGSGTTLLAAQNEGRRCVGIELEEEYCRIAVERLRQPSFFSLPKAPKAKPKQATIWDAPGDG